MRTGGGEILTSRGKKVKKATPSQSSANQTVAIGLKV